MARINVDYNSIVKPLKPMHAVGQPPLLGIDTKYFKYLSDAHIPYSRLHDVGSWFGRNLFVDVPNIFRDFDADENDPANYDFIFTDIIIKGLEKHGCKPVYRLGVTIENFYYVKVYRTNPPKDFAKWARICEHIIRHYNEGWAGGYEFGIEYWEIWNEPEVGVVKPVHGNGCWTGTMEQYFDFYSTAATHLKKCFGDKIKIGGYACSGLYGLFADPEKYGIPCEKMSGERYESAQEENRLRYFYSFFDHIKKNNVPLDFFTWHSYMPLEMTGMEADFFERELEKLGYGHVECHLNEWNIAIQLENYLSGFAVAQDAAMMLMMQDKKVDMLNFYDAKLGGGVYGGLFSSLDYTPNPAYYCFYAFGEMYHELKNQAKCEIEGEGFFAVAATDGDRKAIMIANATDKCIRIDTNLDKNMDVYIIDENHNLTKTFIQADSFNLFGNQVIYIKNF